MKKINRTLKATEKQNWRVYYLCLLIVVSMLASVGWIANMIYEKQIPVHVPTLSLWDMAIFLLPLMFLTRDHGENIFPDLKTTLRISAVIILPLTIIIGYTNHVSHQYTELDRHMESINRLAQSFLSGEPLPPKGGSFINRPAGSRLG